MHPKSDGFAKVRLLVGLVLLMGTIILTSGQQGEVIKGGVVVTTAGGTGGSTTGGTTTSTTSGTTGGEDVYEGYIAKVEEVKAADSVYITSPSSGLTNVTNRHVVRLKIKGSESGPNTTYQPDGYTVSSSYTAYIGVPVGSEISKTTTTQQYTIIEPNANNPVRLAAVYVPMAPGQSMNVGIVNVQRGSSATLTSGPIDVYMLVSSTSTKYFYSGANPQGTTSNIWTVYNLYADKLPLEAISLDSRRVYGKANLDGELPGDPNADLGNNNFQPWVYKGGLFTGNMPYGSSKDQSGTARTQLRLLGVTDLENFTVACVTLFANGTRGSVAPGTLGLYRPSPTDPNLNTGLLTSWWNKWNVNPGVGAPAQGDYTNVPYWSMPLASSDQLQYINWQLPTKTRSLNTQYGSGDGLMWSHYSIASDNEAAHTWQYFSSIWNQQLLGQQFPISDSQPRVWRIRSVTP